MTVADEIKRLRLSLMIHSVIYYDMNENIISDAEWSARAKKLVKLQKEHPDVAKKVCLADLYADFDGSTGFHLAKAADDRAIAKAKYLLLMKGRKKK